MDAQTKALLDAVELQRNEALNALAYARADLAVAQSTNKALFDSLQAAIKDRDTLAKQVMEPPA